MKNTELMPLLTAYSQRYGAFTMGDETMSMFWDKLNHLTAEQCKSSFHELLGAHSKPFGWKAVVTVAEAMYPRESPHKANERQWRDNAKNNDSSKKERIGAIMRKLILRNKRRPFDWVTEYAAQFVGVWGVAEAEKICDKMGNNYTDGMDKDGNSIKAHVPLNSYQSRFIKAVRAVILVKGDL